VDVDRFTAPRAGNRAGQLRIGYLGSLGPRYLVAEMVRLFRAIKNLRTDAHLRVLTKSDATLLHQACRAHGLSADDYSVSSVDHAGVVRELGAMHATLSLVEPGRSSVASCPTKFAESLATGCPVVVNSGVGDCADIVRRDAVGVVHDPDMDPAASARALLHLLEELGLSDRCRQTAVTSFSLPWAVDTYTALYARLAGGVS
jgi:glycosyltransferase involved in cell wall biosynthesis